MSKVYNQEKTVEFDNSYDQKPFSIDLGNGLSFEVWISCDLNLVFNYTEAVAGTYNDPPQDSRIDIDWSSASFEVTHLEVKLACAAFPSACDICEGDGNDPQVKRFLNFWVDGISAEGDHRASKYLLDEIEQRFDIETLESALEGVDVVEDAKESTLDCEMV